MNYVVEAQHLTKRYRDFTAVNDISFFVKSGETFSIGGNGGKINYDANDCWLALTQASRVNESMADKERDTFVIALFARK